MSIDQRSADQTSPHDGQNPSPQGGFAETSTTTAAPDPLWYKDAIIYQLHIKAFFDGNNDGIGDFSGLASKLDYLQDLGINTLWVLPFYPSPLRDDGYDIADYRNINPSYGTMEDFRNFVDEVHRRGMRVITELVINHTSDAHPWFQAARLAPAGSPERDFYVWSDTDQKYLGTRIIFNDTEPSNWSWDPVAKQYYWHRFFAHQPDLNFDNPAVLAEVIDVMYYWLDMGVDGLRLDAIPYLVERDGTSNENIPETHKVIKDIRAALDARYPDRLLLAEANMWPEDVLPYFGEVNPETGYGDECHMAFHFPVMPRLYMALAQEDRHPVTDIMEQTPEIPENCQWAMFLRNHDELTLEMVTDRERDYMWNFYAAEKKARINFGIRRRLAPLMENDRRKIELLNGLLMSLPGTPTLYYGDELGMGDNIYLKDRDGVRTPMQWSPDRNGGFSKADPASLYLPAIMDPVYGFQSVNVEAQARVQNSLYNWIKRLIAARNGSKLGRGPIHFIKPDNRKVLAYTRTSGDETILCVANLSRAAQPAELDLKEFAGRVPVEMLSQSTFPTIGALPYFLSIPPYGFWWFRLTAPVAADAPAAIPYSELSTLVMPKGWQDIQTGGARRLLETRILPRFLVRQRWYKAKDAAPPQTELVENYAMGDYRLLLVAATPPNGARQMYFLALGIAWETMEDDPYQRMQSYALSKVRQNSRIGVLYEAFNSEDFMRVLLRSLVGGETMHGAATRLLFGTHPNFPKIDADSVPIKLLGVEQSNTSVLVGDALVFKAVRQPPHGVSPEEEIGRFFAEQSPFPNAPALLASIRIEGGEEPLTIALANAAVPNQGDGWNFTTQYLERFGSDAQLLKPEEQNLALGQQHAYYFDMAETLGERTAEMHIALAKVTGDESFDAETVDATQRAAWIEDAQAMAGKAQRLLQNALPQLDAETLPEAEALLAQWGAVRDMIETMLPAKLGVKKTRVHGDYHLGQVLVSQNDFYIIDFEGEPARSLEERRRKHSPYKDVAGMVRSFDYAAAAALLAATTGTEEERLHRKEFLHAWRDAATEAFLKGYAATATHAGVAGEESEHLRFFTLEKALYEIVYEAQNRPSWLGIPLRGVRRLIETASSKEAPHGE